MVTISQAGKLPNATTRNDSERAAVIPLTDKAPEKILQKRKSGSKGQSEGGNVVKETEDIPQNYPAEAEIE
jgi:hypothetical protein